jgi:lauroyl/myristoyl acyltransferase
LVGLFLRECEKWIDELVKEWLFDMRRWRDRSIGMKDGF